MRLGSESKELLMTMNNRTACMIIAFLLWGAAPALAQTARSTPRHVPLQKTIGQTGPDIVSSEESVRSRSLDRDGERVIMKVVAGTGFEPMTFRL
jgi:hypothetical protein